jgi:hypothetical protein
MIVCSLPRCGATRFCLDLQEKTSLPFVGELHPIHIESDRKAQTHETGFQTNFTQDSFAELLQDHSEHIILVNQHSYLLANQASFFILRKNMRNAALSMANYLLKVYPELKPNAIRFNIGLMYNDYRALIAYLNKYQKEVIWYEDYYGIEDTHTPLLDSYPGRDSIIKEIDSYYGRKN